MSPKGIVSIPLAGLIAPTLKVEYKEHKLYLLAWIVRLGDGPEKTIDVGIFNEPEPAAPPSKTGETYRTAIIADADGRDYEEAASKLYHAVDTHPHLRHWVPNMPLFKKQRTTGTINLKRVG